jgi:hypothetical protein
VPPLAGARSCLAPRGASSRAAGLEGPRARAGREIEGFGQSPHRVRIGPSPLAALQPAHGVRLSPALNASSSCVRPAASLRPLSRAPKVPSFATAMCLRPALVLTPPATIGRRHRRYRGMVARRLTARRTLECLGHYPSGVCGVRTPRGAPKRQQRDASRATINEKGDPKGVCRLPPLRTGGSRDPGARACRTDGRAAGARR